jgi:hypothetical protein
LTRKPVVSLAIGLAILSLSLSAGQPGLTGAIKGRITNEKGAPLRGAYLYISSPSALGISNFMTPKSGLFEVAGLEPGVYKVVVEMPGYKTVTMGGVRVSAGSRSTANFRLEPTAVEEEPGTARAGSGLDRDSARYAHVIDHDLIDRLPLHRDLSALLGIVPGLISETDPGQGPIAIGGAPFSEAVVDQDGIVVSHPTDTHVMDRVNTELIDEMVVESAAHPVERGPDQGAYITLIHKPGAIAPRGSLLYSASGRGLVHTLWSPEELAQMPDAVPTSLRREHDVSFSLAAPVLEDMAWFFTNMRFNSLGSRAPFNYWTDPVGVRHFVYDYKQEDLAGTFKLGLSILDKIKGVIELGFTKLDEPVDAAEVDKLRPEAATRSLAERTFLARIAASYVLDENMRADVNIGYAHFNQPLTLDVAAVDKPQYFDIVTGRSFGSGSLNDREKSDRMRGNAAVTRLWDGLLGGFHEIVAGADYETMSTSSSTWKADNLIYNYANGSPYTYGQTVSPESGEEVGWGLVGFYIAPSTDNMVLKRQVQRFGFFLQDTVKIAGRLSLSAGLRFDRSSAHFGAFTKGSSGNSVGTSLGTSLVKPVLGYNIYSSISLSAWDNAIIWSAFSPRFGLSFDVFGNGRTLLKGSWARLPEYLGLGYSQDLSPIDPTASHDFVWYDENGDGAVDSDDTFTLVPYDFRVYSTGYSHQAVQPKLSAPVIEEWTAGIEQEIGSGFSLGVRYIDRRHSNLIGHVVFDPSTGAEWWRLEDAPTGWWVPFTTTVPGTDGYADETVNMYVPAATAPAYFERIENVPELTARYRSLEFSFTKRMSHNWQAFGSLTWNRATGNATIASRWNAGNSPYLLTPNAFINISSTDRLSQDRPLVARLAGTFRFPADIYASVIVKVQSGPTWGRTVTIIPPADWAAANGAQVVPVKVYLESPGSRRFGSWKTVDFRLEKEFLRAGRSAFGLSVDVYNLLGTKYRLLDLNDGGTWAPADEGGTTGTRILSGTYGTYTPLIGTRVVRLNLSLKF